jgi:hypothetical protein
MLAKVFQPCVPPEGSRVFVTRVAECARGNGAAEQLFNPALPLFVSVLYLDAVAVAAGFGFDSVVHLLLSCFG